MSTSRKINIVLPGFPRAAGGGYKIMFEYANRLSEKGYDVVIYYSMKVSYTKYTYPHFLRFIKNKFYSYRGIPTWFELSSKIPTHYIKSIKDKYIRDADYTMSTWWATALDVYKLSQSKGLKINLIQDFEDWTGNVDLVYESYKLPIVQIVINDYLKELVHQTSGRYPHLIYNAIDSSIFNLQVDIKGRFNRSICMLYSAQPRKGSKYGLEALLRVKNRYDDLEVHLFSVEDKPADIPEWIFYHKRPDNLTEIYNNCAIFFSPSNGEGWALPPAEAMFCGCALVCTDIPGHSAYLRNNIFNLGVPIKDPDKMSEALIYLIDNYEKRIEYATKGNNFIKKFAWDKSIAQFINILNTY